MAVLMTAQTLQRTVTPIVTKIIEGIYEQTKDEWRNFMKEEKGMEYEFHNLTVMYGFGQAPLRNPGEATAYDTAGVMYNINIYYNVYSLAFAMTKQMIADSKMNLQAIKLFSRHLAQSLIETKELNCANILNFGFNPNFAQAGGGDGQPLFSANHPSAAGTPARSNILATPALLSQTSLEQMAINISKQKDARGKFIKLKPKALIVPPEQRFQAQALLESVLRADSANNTVNVMNGYFDDGHKVVTRLTSPTAWFVTNEGFSGDGVLLLTREMPHVAQEGDFDTDSLRIKTQERYGLGWGDFLCMAGTTGV